MNYVWTCVRSAWGGSTFTKISYNDPYPGHCARESCYSYNKRYDKYGYWSQEKYDSDVEQAKKLIDWLIELSTKQELMDDIDRVLDTYFEAVFKHNGRKEQH